MKSQSKINALRFAVIAACAAISQTLTASVFDFSGAVPVYDANRSTTTAGSGAYSFDELADKATVGFNWSNSQWGSDWYYSWDGVNASTCSDTTVDVSKYYLAGEKASYTSITGTDASGVAGGAYGVFFGNTSSELGGSSVSDLGIIVLNELSNVSSISLVNTLVSYDYFSKNLNDDGDFYLQEVRIFGLDSSLEKTSNYVSVALSSAADGVADSWLTADISALNVDGGLYGVYFEIYTDNYNSYGALAPAYFAFDNLNYAAVPEPATYAALFGIVALATVFYRRRARK